MDRARDHRILAAVLLWAALRGWWVAWEPPPRDLLEPATGPPTALPELAHDGWIELSRLPGIGPERARRIVQERAHLGVPLTPSRLRLIPGIGDGTAAEVEAWYARAGRGPPVPPG